MSGVTLYVDLKAILFPTLFDTGQQTLIEIYVSRTIKSIGRPINIKYLTNTHQSLYTAIIIGNAFHISGILPVGNALLIEGAAAEDKTCVLLHKTNTGIYIIKQCF